MKKLKLLLNIGTADKEKLGLKETQEGKTVSVGEKVAQELLSRGWAAPEGEDAPVASAVKPSRQATAAPAGVPVAIRDDDDSAGDTSSDADTSPVSASNATEAIDQIGRMRSRDRLQHVVDNDPRMTVKDAARKRLAAL